MRLYDTRLPRSLMGGSRGMHFTYPPFAALLFWPFVKLSVGVAQAVWSILNVLALAALTALSIRVVRPELPIRRVWIIASIALFPILQLRPDALTLSYGQVNFFIALLVLLDLTSTIRFGAHTLPRGSLLGIAAAIKLIPLIFIAFLILTRQFRAAMTALAAFLLCTLGALAIAPRSSWVYWSTEVFNAKHSGNLLYISDQNLQSAIQRIIGAHLTLAILTPLSAVFALAGLQVAAWAYQASSPILGILICAATGLIVSPVSWVHHYVWIVPVLVWLALAHDRPRGGRWWALGAAGLFWAAPMWRVTNPQQGYGGPLTLVESNAFCLAAMAFIALTAARLWWRRRIAVATETQASAALA
jgi:alpha-1,2-mannosyltransferase